jgi:serine/threonine protein kinase
VDARSDIFSFGSVFYEMVTGRRAFQGNTPASTQAAILKESPKPASQVVEALPREVERLISRCLREDVNQRFQHMDEMKISLEELKEESDSGALDAAGTAGAAVCRQQSAELDASGFLHSLQGMWGGLQSPLSLMAEL